MLRPCCVRSRSATRRGAVDRARGAVRAWFGSIGDEFKENFPFATRPVLNPFSEAALEELMELECRTRRLLRTEREQFRPRRRPVRPPVPPGGDRGDRGPDHVRDLSIPSPQGCRFDSIFPRGGTRRELGLRPDVPRVGRFADSPSCARRWLRRSPRRPRSPRPREENEAYRAADGGAARRRFVPEHRRVPPRRVKSAGSTVDSVASPSRVGPAASAVAERAARSVRWDSTLKRQLRVSARFRGAPRTTREGAPRGTGTPSNASSFRNGCCARRCSSSRRSSPSARRNAGECFAASASLFAGARTTDSPSSRSIPGRARGQLAGSSTTELLPPEDRSHVEELRVRCCTARSSSSRSAGARRSTSRRSIGASPGSDPALPRGWTPEESKVTSAASLSFSPRRFRTRIRSRESNQRRHRVRAREVSRGGTRASTRTRRSSSTGAKARETATRRDLRAVVHPRALQTSQSAVGRDGVERRGVRGRGGRRTDRRRCWDGVVVVAAVEIQSPGGRRRRRRRFRGGGGGG